MPADRLALPIGVGRQVNMVGFFGFLGQFPNRLAGLIGNGVGRREFILHINSQLLFGQITHMPH